MTSTTVPEGRKKFFAELSGEKNRLTPSSARYAMWLGLPVFADYAPQPGRTNTRRVLTITKEKPRQIVLDADARTVTVTADAVTLLWTPKQPAKETR